MEVTFDFPAPRWNPGFNGYIGVIGGLLDWSNAEISKILDNFPPLKGQNPECGNEVFATGVSKEAKRASNI